MKKKFISLLTSVVVAASMMFAGTTAVFADVEEPAVEESTPVIEEVTGEEQAEAEGIVEEETATEPAANEALEGDTEMHLMGDSTSDAEAVTISGSSKIGEYEGDAAYYATVPAGTTNVQFTDFDADNVMMVARYDMMSNDMVMDDNTCPVYSSFKVSADDINEFLDDGLLDGDNNDYSNTYGFVVYTYDDEYSYFFINVGAGGGNDEPAPVELPTLATIYGHGLLIAEKYSSYDFSAGTTGEYPVYQLNVPACADEVTLKLSKECLLYNYDANGTYLSGYFSDVTKGVEEMTVPIDANKDGIGDYIQIQNPYVKDASALYGYSGGELLYAVKLNPVSATSNVGKMLKSDESYEYCDFSAGVTNKYSTVELVVPKGTEEVTLSMNEECLVYNYDGKGTYLAGNFADVTKGVKEMTVKTDANKDGIGDYIQIQNPYVKDASAPYGYGGGEMLFAVKISYQPEYAAATLSGNAYTYTGKAIAPEVTVTNDEGATLKAGTDYTVAYKNNKTVGTATAVVTGKGDYTFTKNLTFKINPVGTKLVKVKKAGKGKMKVTWKKQTTKTTPFTGYQVRYSKKSSMEGAKYKSVSKKAVKSKKIKTGKGKFYVQVRTYKVVNGTKYYSNWSAKKTVKVK